MTEQELLHMRDMAESGAVQFKERANDRYDIGCEMVAFSNSRGGKLVIGINDKTGEVNALSYMELQETTNLLTNVASENVIPNVLIDVENEPTSNGVSGSDEITHTANEFVITIPRDSNVAWSESNQVTDPVQAKNDQAYSKSEQPNDQLTHNTDQAYSKSEQPNNQLTHNSDQAYSKSEQPHIKLSKKQIDIRNFCSIPRTAKEIMGRLGLSDFYNNRKRYIYDLVEAGVLERTIPEKPNDPNQKYRRRK